MSNNLSNNKTLSSASRSVGRSVCCLCLQLTLVGPDHLRQIPCYRTAQHPTTTTFQIPTTTDHLHNSHAQQPLTATSSLATAGSGHATCEDRRQRTTHTTRGGG